MKNGLSVVDHFGYIHLSTGASLGEINPANLALESHVLGYERSTEGRIDATIGESISLTAITNLHHFC